MREAVGICQRLARADGVDSIGQPLGQLLRVFERQVGHTRDDIIGVGTAPVERLRDELSKLPANTRGPLLQELLNRHFGAKTGGPTGVQKAAMSALWEVPTSSHRGHESGEAASASLAHGLLQGLSPTGRRQVLADFTAEMSQSDSSPERQFAREDI